MSTVTSIELPLAPRSPEASGPRPRAVRGAAASRRFVAGPENRSVVAVVQRLLIPSDDDRQLLAWSPISFVGPSGCGKTHLARGVAGVWSERFGGEGGEDVLCLSANDLRRQLDDAIRRHEVAAFRDRIRGLRLLVIEDLHRATGAAHFRQELAATLDALREAGGLVVATMTKPLSESRSFDRQLISRFAAGLTVDVAPLALEARTELLRLALEDQSCQADTTAVAEVSAALSSDARRVIQVAGQMRERFGTRRTIGRDEAKAFLAERAAGATSPPLREIAAAASRYYKIPLRDLRSSSRRQHVVLARSLAIYLARQLTPLSYDEIGRYFGGRDHTTIMHNYQRIDARLGGDRALRAAVEEVRAALGAA